MFSARPWVKLKPSHNFGLVRVASIVERGSGCDPVVAPVFKTGGRLRRASGGGFDSHPFPSLKKFNFCAEVELLFSPTCLTVQTSATLSANPHGCERSGKWCAQVALHRGPRHPQNS